MEAFTIVDAIVAVIIFVSAILAYARGFVREMLAIAGWVLAAVAAFFLAPHASPWLHEIPMIGNILRDSCELSVIGAFAIVFAIALVVAALFTPAFSSAVRNSALGGLDQGAGFLFGALRGIVLVAIAYFVYANALPGDGIAVIDDSRTASIAQQMQGGIDEAMPEQIPAWLINRYEELVAHCNGA